MHQVFYVDLYNCVHIHEPQCTDFERQHTPVNPIPETEAPTADYTLLQHYSESVMKEQ